jgi:hypothetical protein
MRHLTTRHDVAFGILNNLGRRQRRRLGRNCDGVHDVALSLLTHGVERPVRYPDRANRIAPRSIGHGRVERSRRRCYSGVRTCMKPMAVLDGLRH